MLDAIACYEPDIRLLHLVHEFPDEGLKHVLRYRYSAITKLDPVDPLKSIFQKGGGKPDAILIDLQRPKCLDLCRRLAVQGGTLRVSTFLEGPRSDLSELLSAGAGADGYIPRPLTVAKIISRLVQLRRWTPPPERFEGDGSTATSVVAPTLETAIMEKTEGVTLGETDCAENTCLQIFPSVRCISLCDQKVRLPKLEFDVLLYLVANKHRLVGREELYECVWGMDFIPGSDTLGQKILHIRKALAKAGLVGAIETIPKGGFRFIGSALVSEM